MPLPVSSVATSLESGLSRTGDNDGDEDDINNPTTTAELRSFWSSVTAMCADKKTIGFFPPSARTCIPSATTWLPGTLLVPGTRYQVPGTICSICRPSIL